MTYPFVEPIPGTTKALFHHSPTHFVSMQAEAAQALLTGEGRDWGGPEVLVRDPNKHDREKWEKLYSPIFEGCEKDGMKVPRPEFVACEELAHPVAEREWPHYHKGDRVKGPRPFRSMSERREYLKRYGFGEA